MMNMLAAGLVHAALDAEVIVLRGQGTLGCMRVLSQTQRKIAPTHRCISSKRVGDILHTLVLHGRTARLSAR